MANITVRGAEKPLQVANIYCIGANYAEHNREMGRAPAAEPVVFLKPTSAILSTDRAIQLPEFSKEVHHEVEMVLLIGKGGKNIAEADALGHVSAVAVGIDLTARDIQLQAKQAGKPWTVAKGFDGSAALSDFVAVSRFSSLDNVSLIW